MSKEIKNNIVIYQGENGNVELRADVENDTVWGTQAQIAELFDTTIPNINVHLKNIYDQNELDKNRTIKENLIVQKEGGRAVKRKIELYNLDVILSVGYRVNSRNATQFRIWATKTLREYIVEGYAINKHRLESTPEKLIGLYDAITFLESRSCNGRLKGKITLKLTEELEPTEE